ncbi:MAG TPA: CehA/McbA family metallohydrolase, partial [Polyangiaceae bacterium]
MNAPSDRLRYALGAGVFVLVVALVARQSPNCGSTKDNRPHVAVFTSAHARIEWHPGGELQFKSTNGARSVDAELVLVDEDGTHRVGLTQPVVGPDGALRGTIRLTPESRAIPIVVDVDPAKDTLRLAIPGDVDAALGDGTPSVGLALSLARRTAFVEGHGPIADLGHERAPSVLVEGEGAPLAMVAGNGELDVTVGVGEGLELVATVQASAGSALHVILAPDVASELAAVNAAMKRSTKEVFGVVTGAKGPLHVIGLDAEGMPQVRFPTDAHGRFRVQVPETVTEWYASVDATRTSAPVHLVPGSGFELRLDVSEGGELAVRIEDGDTRDPITARLLVHGVDGTLDPNFGPDFRASGAGPIIDALRGEVTTPVPAGRYRVAATKGIEWSIDAQIVDVAPGKRVSLVLAPRHVVPTKGWLGCDLHVHARPSFDSPVTVEDRVLSLVSAGVDFAVPTEHNIVGDYGPPLEVLGLSGELGTVNGVEITTYSPRFGHFGLFPYPPKSPVPPYRATTPAQLFAAARMGDPGHRRILQVNHPRLPKDIGYFTVQGYRRGGPVPASMRTDFDALEVYNGYDLAVPSRVDEVLGDWFALLEAGHRYVATGSSDSHRIQYQWAGYPRTMIEVSDDKPIDPLAVVAALKKGHAFVTSGPVLELTLGGGHPGDEVVVASGAKSVDGHVTVRAAPWIDVTSLDLVVGGVVVQTLP